jgi:fumarate reductase (CoM/CoB) subunit A
MSAIETEWRDYDVIVVGSGGAGGAAAHAATEAGARVLVVSKDPIGCSDTKIAEGVTTVRASAEDGDTEAVLSENLRIAGGDLPPPEITRAFAQDTEDAYNWLRRHGVRPRIDQARGTPRTLPIPLGGHTHRRSIGHDNGGLAFGHAAWNAVVQGIDYLEDAWFLDIVTEPGADGPAVRGGIVYDAIRGCFVAVRAPAVIIAAGGLSTLYYPKTDTMRGNTGDSYALALRAGADLVDMEQTQFLPFCLTAPPSYEGLLVGEPATAGFLGVLRDARGKVLLDAVMVRTRAECSAAIVRAVADGRGTERGGCYLDLTGNVKAERSGVYYKNFMETSLAGVMSTVRQALGRKAAAFQEIWEVRPGAHYAMGGARVNEHGSTITDNGADNGAPAVRRLFAAGQAMGGVFGANRLGSTSLAEGPIFGARAGRAAAELARAGNSMADPVFETHLAPYRNMLGHAGSKPASALIRRLQEACWNGIGPARTGDGMDDFMAELSDIRRDADDAAIGPEALWNQSFIDAIELANMLDTAEAVARAAQDRPQSLGAHIRLDGPDASLLFAKTHSVVVRRDADGDWTLSHAARPPTSWRRLLGYAIRDRKRKAALKLLRLLPVAAQDRILEKRYRATMGAIAQPDAEAA